MTLRPSAAAVLLAALALSSCASTVVAEPARAEVAGDLLRLSGEDGSLVLERAEIE